MQKLKFKSSDGNIICDITVKKSNITKIDLESLFIPLMLHMELCITLSTDSKVFNDIRNMRSEFYTNVLKYLVNLNYMNGNEVPKEITDFLIQDKKSTNWYHDD